VDCRLAIIFNTDRVEDKNNKLQSTHTAQTFAKIFIFYSWLRTKIAIVNKNSFNKFRDVDRDLDCAIQIATKI